MWSCMNCSTVGLCGADRHAAEADANVPTGLTVRDGTVDSGHAAGAALAWAMAWAVQAAGCPEFEYATFAFRYDATYIGDAAAGWCSLRADPALGEQLFGIGTEAKGTPAGCGR